MLKIADLLQHYVYRGGELPPPNDPGFQYILGGNGLFVQAKSELMHVAQPIARARVRGLPPIKGFVRLAHRRLAGRTISIIINHARKHPDIEVVYQVTADYKIHVVAYGTKAAAKFENRETRDGLPIILEAHSHNTMAAYFSPTDNDYENYFRWYMVVGRVTDERPQVAFRLGVHGHHIRMPLESLFRLEGHEKIEVML